jgi:hypothetical protein
MYTWKYNSETACVAILNKQKCLFSKMKDRKIKQVPFWCWYQWEWGGYREGVKKGKFGGNICLMYENGKMRLIETILRRGEK